MPVITAILIFPRSILSQPSIHERDLDPFMARRSKDKEFAIIGLGQSVDYGRAKEPGRRTRYLLIARDENLIKDLRGFSMLLIG
jgi:hypothetical protein